MGLTLSQSLNSKSQPQKDGPTNESSVNQPLSSPFSHRLPKILLPQASSDDNRSRATDSTGQLTPPSPVGNAGPPSATKKGTNLHHWQPCAHPSEVSSHYPEVLSRGNLANPLRYTNSTRNLRSGATLLPRRGSDSNFSPSLDKPQPLHDVKAMGRKETKSILTSKDKRSNPVKFPRRRKPYASQHHQGNSRDFHPATNDLASSQNRHEEDTPQDESYLERMYDSRTWEMYRRIISHREKVDAFNAANAAARRGSQCSNEDRTNFTTVSEPLKRATNMVRVAPLSEKAKLGTTAADDSANQDGLSFRDHYHSFASEEGYDPATCGLYQYPTEGAFDEHSAPPYHHHHTHYCDSGRCHQRQHHHSTENYSEWEHMYGDVEEPANGADPAIFLFDF